MTVEGRSSLEQTGSRIVEGTGVKILIVDDNIKNLYMLEVLLKGSGYEVVTAKNGIEALEKLHANQFDGIVSDILMPIMDGFQMIRECKKDPVLRQIPFIFYTATYTEKKDEEFGLSLGAIRYIIKPAEPEDLLRQIHEAFIDDARFPTDKTMHPVPDEVTFSREYTQRVGAKLEKKTRALLKSEEKFRTLYETMAQGVVYQDSNGRITEANPAAERILGITIAQMQGRTSFDPQWKAVHEDGSDYPGESHPSILALATGKECQSIMGVFNPADGKRHWILIDAIPQYIEGGQKPFQVYTTFQDVTDLKNIEEQLKRFNEELEKQVGERTEQLKKSLHEKEILLKEIHHRVKNNMQIITSLLNLQTRTIDDPVVLRMIKESQSRIKAMALVHERLYQSGDISSIDLKDYTQFLARELFSFYGVKSQLMRFTINASAINVNINSAIPLGLIVNELISNSIKYAFPEDRKGEIVIEITKEKNDISLVVRDNGVGIPQDLDWRNAKSLGLRLVISLVEQLNGTIDLDRTAGTIFRIKVKEKL